MLNNKGDVVIIDFGLARFYAQNDSPMTKGVVTQVYRSPELLFGARFFSDKIDMWSIGCIFAEMFLGEALFRGESELDQLSKIFGIMGTPNDQNWPNSSKFIKKI